jgi:ribosomal protein S14
MLAICIAHLIFLNITNPKKYLVNNTKCRIRGSHGSGYEKFYLLRCNYM